MPTLAHIIHMAPPIVQVKDWGSGKPGDLGSLEVDSVTTVSGDPLSGNGSDDRPFYEQLARHLEICQVCAGSRAETAWIWQPLTSGSGCQTGRVHWLELFYTEGKLYAAALPQHLASRFCLQALFRPTT